MRSYPSLTRLVDIAASVIDSAAESSMVEPPAPTGTKQNFLMTKKIVLISDKLSIRLY
jgi:hypothetical protein